MSPSFPLGLLSVSMTLSENTVVLIRRNCLNLDSNQRNVRLRFFLSFLRSLIFFLDQQIKCGSIDFLLITIFNYLVNNWKTILLWFLKILFVKYFWVKGVLSGCAHLMCEALGSILKPHTYFFFWLKFVQFPIIYAVSISLYNLWHLSREYSSAKLC